jgi:hypothetical protein
MPSSKDVLLAFFASLSLLFMGGCCGVNHFVACHRGCMTGCDSCGGMGEAEDACSAADCCPGLLHGKIASRLRQAIFGSCERGCGELYIDERLNEPPVCDPCTGNGEFSGAACGPCKPLWQRVRHLWGTKYGGSCGGAGCQAVSAETGRQAVIHGQDHGGYCSHCRDGVAGTPPGRSSPVEILEESSSTLPPVPSVEVTPEESTDSAGKLQPTPEPLSQQPKQAIPTLAQRPKSSGDAERPASRSRSTSSDQDTRRVKQPAVR